MMKFIGTSFGMLQFAQFPEAVGMPGQGAMGAAIIHPDLAPLHGHASHATMQTYRNPVFPYRRSPDQASGARARHRVVVVGAGPVGLCTALDLAQRGHRVVVLDDDETVSIGSRAVCYAKRTLEVLDRLGCGDPVVARGVSWSRGRVFLRDREVYGFDLLGEPGHERPAFVNLQQYHFEEILVGAVGRHPAIDLRWRNRVVAVEPGGDGVALAIDTPDGRYGIDCDWLVVADGARSPIRHLLGLESKGQVFRDRFLIADVLMKAEYPTERWFWFDPPFHPGQSVLLHRQADNVWRVDFQLGWDADPEEEKKPERVLPRLRAMLGERDFELEWVSVYTFQCRRMDRFRHGRVLFTGDAAHQVSPFGARGANSGIQDADNLGWKLALVLDGIAPAALLDTYSDEREQAADENILNSTRSTDFITPKSAVARAFRDASLELAQRHAFARRLVNSGRLSVPTVLDGSSLSTPDDEAFTGAASTLARPGAPAPDAPLRAPAGGRHWWLRQLDGGFAALVFWDDGGAAEDHGSASSIAALGRLVGSTPDAMTGLAQHPRLPAVAWHVALADEPSPAFVARATALGLRVHVDVEGLLRERHAAQHATVYLLRPDQHVCARWRQAPDDGSFGTRFAGALGRACGLTLHAEVA
jgi:3-(3-hydroxy-phenyl)propionate hydroxylase